MLMLFSIIYSVFCCNIFVSLFTTLLYKIALLTYEVYHASAPLHYLQDHLSNPCCRCAQSAIIHSAGTSCLVLPALKLTTTDNQAS